MTPVDPANDGVVILASMIVIVLFLCAVAYAISEMIKWSQHDKPQDLHPLDTNLYKLKLRPKARRLCLYHIKELKTGVAVLDANNCEYCNRSGA